jgi:hypothetical protein
MKNYDSWLEGPYQRAYGREAPPEVEKLLDAKFYVEEEDAVGEVVEWQAWDDADEDGPYGGYDFIVQFPGGRAIVMSPTQVEEAIERSTQSLK